MNQIHEKVGHELLDLYERRSADPYRPAMTGLLDSEKFRARAADQATVFLISDVIAGGYFNDGDVDHEIDQIRETGRSRTGSSQGSGATTGR